MSRQVAMTCHLGVSGVGRLLGLALHSSLGGFLGTEVHETLGDFRFVSGIAVLFHPPLHRLDLASTLLRLCACLFFALQVLENSIERLEKVFRLAGVLGVAIRRSPERGPVHAQRLGERRHRPTIHSHQFRAPLPGSRCVHPVGSGTVLGAEHHGVPENRGEHRLTKVLMVERESDEVHGESHEVRIAFHAERWLQLDTAAIGRHVDACTLLQHVDAGPEPSGPAGQRSFCLSRFYNHGLQHSGSHCGRQDAGNLCIFH
mmetsp:Transcript_57465/g.135231  ORF Transcript_57465/g.135231 Transcript_57465/m.135231 type:complete len:259 (+) Transcript_57465:398-1174(+)